MAIQLPFEDMFDNILKNLKSSKKVIEISSHFGPEKDSDEMFKYVWDMEEVQTYIHCYIPNKLKDDEKSESFRKDGNDYYKKKILYKALMFYNKSIMYAPQFGCSSSSYSEAAANNNSAEYKEVNTTNLALAYANRSAVLFELKYYTECIQDIDRSFKYGYPILSKGKLIERKAKCYLAQNQRNKATVTLKEGLVFAQDLNLQQQEIITICQSFEKLLSICEGEDRNNDDLEKNGNLLNKNLPEAPPLMTSNKEIPSLSDALTLSYSSDLGRYLMATRDVNPGEILIRESGFSHITLPSSLNTHCSLCLLRVYNPVPCSYCSSVEFCSEECLEKGMTQFHNLECSILSSLISLDLGKNAMLGLRLVMQIPLSTLKLKINKYKNDGVDPSRFGFNENNIYSSESYRPIYYLVTNKEKRSVSDLFKRSVMAACLVKLLLKTNYFGRSFENINELTSSDIENVHFVGSVLLTHMMNLPCNAHSITEMAVDIKKIEDSHMTEIAAGAYGVFSLCNHSCNPSIARSSYGKIIVARAIKFIPKGSEIFDSYGEHFAFHVKEERQNNLSRQYYFKCNCEACTHNWSLYSDIAKTDAINCTNCSNIISSQLDTCTKCGKFTKDIEVYGEENINNMMDLLEQIGIAKNEYVTAFEATRSGQMSDEIIRKIIKIVYYLSKYATLPNILLLEAQETLKHCFDMQGSHRLL